MVAHPFCFSCPSLVLALLFHFEEFGQLHPQLLQQSVRLAQTLAVLSVLLFLASEICQQSLVFRDHGYHLLPPAGRLLHFWWALVPAAAQPSTAGTAAAAGAPDPGVAQARDASSVTLGRGPDRCTESRCQLEYFPQLGEPSSTCGASSCYQLHAATAPFIRGTHRKTQGHRHTVEESRGRRRGGARQLQAQGIAARLMPKQTATATARRTEGAQAPPGSLPLRQERRKLFPKKKRRVELADLTQLSFHPFYLFSLFAFSFQIMLT
nr:uncharacterized protein LOC105495947 [Macaca nemestrina]